MPLAYLQAYLNSYDLSRIVSGTAQPKLTQRALMNIPVPVAPAIEQPAICERLASATAATDVVLARVSEVLEQCGELEQAALRKAFRGELLPQHHADEPASAFVARLRAERATVPTPRARRVPARA